jgi:hypothetical protein
MKLREFFLPRRALVCPLVLASLLWGGPLFSQALPGGQEKNRSDGELEGRDRPYMIPQKVYVGDHARLVVPLGPASAYGGTPEPAGEIPENGDLMILGLELERGGETARLNIDFAAYTTGRVEFPPLVIGPHTITGLAVEISSILEAGGEGRRLSPAVRALPVPGTVMMIYALVIGALLFIVAAALLALWLVKSRDALGRRFRRKRALRFMRKSIRRLKEELDKENFSPRLGGELLGRLSLALRNFLSYVLGCNCLSLVPGEFSGLDFERAGDGLYVEERRGFLVSFFSRSDTLRFGFGIDRGRVASMMEEALEFIAAFEEIGRAHV